MDVKKHLQNARLLTELLDTQWNILGIRFGLDPVFDLIPGAQFFPTLLSGYLVWIALRANLSSGIVVGMPGSSLGNDSLVGCDFGFGVQSECEKSGSARKTHRKRTSGRKSH